MNFRQYILIFGTGTILAWISWVIVVINISPATAGGFMLLVFYFTLFVGLLGTFSTLATVIRMVRNEDNEVELIVARSLRQAFFLTIIIIFSLFLSSKEWLNWMSIFALIGIFGVLEFIVLTKKSARN